MSDVQIEASWKELLQSEFKQPYFPLIRQFIMAEKAKGKTVYPPGNQIFNAFNLTPFSNLKVVIIGQDPYHGAGQAHGLCFSVQDGIKPPPSLVNIYKELSNDIAGFNIPQHGNLESWANQGVLLLNASLTVNAGEANSHAGCGWQTFTDAVISKISKHATGIVFILWGRFAQQKEQLIDTSKHFVLKSGHPSPFSVNLFLGCRHFSTTNELLIKQGKQPINWQV